MSTTTNTSDARALVDAEHLRLLSIFHFVSAGLAFCGTAFSSFYFLIFQTIFSNPDFWAKSQQGPPPPEVMEMLRGFVGVFVVWFLLSAIANLLSGLFMRARRYRIFSMIVAGLNCLHIPLGTILGIFTFIVLGRESVGRLYEAKSQAPDGAPNNEP